MIDFIAKIFISGYVIIFFSGITVQIVILFNKWNRGKQYLKTMAETLYGIAITAILSLIYTFKVEKEFFFATVTIWIPVFLFGCFIFYLDHRSKNKS